LGAPATKRGVSTPSGNVAEEIKYDISLFGTKISYWSIIVLRDSIT
jgi:hypothetical protein